MYRFYTIHRNKVCDKSSPTTSDDLYKCPNCSTPYWRQMYRYYTMHQNKVSSLYRILILYIVLILRNGTQKRHKYYWYDTMKQVEKENNQYSTINIRIIDSLLPDSRWIRKLIIVLQTTQAQRRKCKRKATINQVFIIQLC